ncbi:MAG: hypothetical protein IPL70_20050 [Uliginosibacterium sp.]|nr:hypothetical protein [Uliginosibacterium sp.]
MGVFTVHAAIQATPDDGVRLDRAEPRREWHRAGAQQPGRIPGTGPFLWRHRHPGDNWEDRSLMQAGVAPHFTERPKQLSRVIDALLGGPGLASAYCQRFAGPARRRLRATRWRLYRAGIGGRQIDFARYGTHCAQHRAEDPIFCSMGKASTPSASPAAAMPPLGDSRVRAVVALAPAGAMFQADAFAEVKIPVAVYAAEHDRFNVPRFHAEWIHSNLPGSQLQTVKNAGHYAFMDTPSISIQTPAGICAPTRPALTDRHS